MNDDWQCTPIKLDNGNYYMHPNQTLVTLERSAGLKYILKSHQVLTLPVALKINPLHTNTWNHCKRPTTHTLYAVCDVFKLFILPPRWYSNENTLEKSFWLEETWSCWNRFFNSCDSSSANNIIKQMIRNKIKNTMAILLDSTGSSNITNHMSQDWYLWLHSSEDWI